MKARKAKVATVKVGKRHAEGKEPYMSDAAFNDLQSSLQDALDYERGERPDLRVTRLSLPPTLKSISRAKVVNIRKHMHCSQAMFARVLNVSARTVQDWEQGRRKPSDAALKLLVIAEKHPEVLLEG